MNEDNRVNSALNYLSGVQGLNNVSEVDNDLYVELNSRFFSDEHVSHFAHTHTHTHTHTLSEGHSNSTRTHANTGTLYSCSTRI